MIWWFHGEHFSLDIDAAGVRTFLLEAAWHKPIPDMGGPRPEFEVEEVEALFSRPMVVRLLADGPERILAEAQEYAQVASGTRLGECEYLPRCMVTTGPDGPSIEVTVALDPAHFASVSSSLLAYSTAAAPKFFSGCWWGTFLIGSKRRTSTNEDIRAFLAGERPALSEATPSLTFRFGTVVPKPPDFFEVVKTLKRQFE